MPSQKGVLVTQKDEGQGVLYFTLAGNTPNLGTVTLFVTDDRATRYKLILVPSAIAAAFWNVVRACWLRPLWA